MGRRRSQLPAREVRAEGSGRRRRWNGGDVTLAADPGLRDLPRPSARRRASYGSGEPGRGGRASTGPTAPRSSCASRSAPRSRRPGGAAHGSAHREAARAVAARRQGGQGNAKFGDADAVDAALRGGRHLRARRRRSSLRLEADGRRRVAPPRTRASPRSCAPDLERDAEGGRVPGSRRPRRCSARSRAGRAPATVADVPAIEGASEGVGLGHEFAHLGAHGCSCTRSTRPRRTSRGASGRSTASWRCSTAPASRAAAGHRPEQARPARRCDVVRARRPAHSRRVRRVGVDRCRDRRAEADALHALPEAPPELPEEREFLEYRPKPEGRGRTASTAPTGATASSATRPRATDRRPH